MKESHLEEQPKITVKLVGIKDLNLLEKIAKTEREAFSYEINVHDFQKMIERGESVIVVYSNGQLAGHATVIMDADPHNSKPITRKLPEESSWAYGAVVVPEFRGKGLQKRLLEERIKLAIENGKETLMGCVRLENGASLRNIASTGGRILAFSPDFFVPTENPTRLIFEIDATLLKEKTEQINKKEALTPQMALEAAEKEEKKIILTVKDGGEQDFEAEEAAAQILSHDYVGTNIETLSTGEGSRCNGVLFRHLSSFPPEVAKCLRERKEKIQKLLEPSKEKLELTAELATEKDFEEIKKLMLFAANEEDASLLGTNLKKQEASFNNSEAKARFFNFDRFVVLARNKNEVVGVTFARQRELGVWHIPYAYVKPDSRGDAGIRMLSVGLTKILGKNGKKVEFAVKKKNTKMIKFAKRIGAINKRKHPVLIDKNKNRFGKLGYLMELNLTNPEVIKKLKRASNAG